MISRDGRGTSDNRAVSRGGGALRRLAAAGSGKVFAREGRRTPLRSPGGELRGVVNAWTLSASGLCRRDNVVFMSCCTFPGVGGWRYRE